MKSFSIIMTGKLLHYSRRHMIQGVYPALVMLWPLWLAFRSITASGQNDTMNLFAGRKLHDSVRILGQEPQARLLHFEISKR
jgi:hypothetical protein